MFHSVVVRRRELDWVRIGLLVDSLCSLLYASASVCVCRRKAGEKKASTIIGFQAETPCFFSCLLSGVILYWLNVSTINALQVVKHQAFYLAKRRRLHLISCSPLLLLPVHPRGGGGGGGMQTKKIQTKTQEWTCGDGESARFSASIPNVDDARRSFKRQWLNGMQTMWCSFPR